MRVLIDYRSALRSRSGVGEYTYRLVKALHDTGAGAEADRRLELTVFSSSWKDRLVVPRELEGVDTVDRRVPVSLLNFAWHRLGFPSAETIAGRPIDVVHSLHPLLMPARNAAQVVTVHDLDFLEHPERTQREIRRDYPRLAGDHARRADRVIAVSEFTAREVTRQLQVPPDRISICRAGAPDWSPRPTRSKRGFADRRGGYILFLGTLEPRKNVGTLLDAVERLLNTDAPWATGAGPLLVLAGGATADARSWLERLTRPPLAGRAVHLGYVEPARRRSIYDEAALLVQPSLNEGFGLPVLEAMTLGVPVVAANRGALPEVLGDAGLLVEPEDSGQMADAIARLLGDPQLAASYAQRGIARAQQFRWSETATRTIEAYRLAVEHRARRQTVS